LDSGYLDQIRVNVAEGAADIPQPPDSDVERRLAQLRTVAPDARLVGPLRQVMIGRKSGWTSRISPTLKSVPITFSTNWLLEDGLLYSIVFKAAAHRAEGTGSRISAFSKWR
jgi:hypothetical protein